jgi:very-short-patch-repair endonuclease
MSTTRARSLRRNSTDAERAMWRILRNRQLAGFKFRRQQPLGAFIVDFVCFSHRLIIEIDGGQHAENATDERRTAWLERQGFRVLRFWNNDVLANGDGVYLAVLEALTSRPPPHPAR